MRNNSLIAGKDDVIVGFLAESENERSRIDNNHLCTIYHIVI